MKTSKILFALSLAAAAVGSAQAGTDVGVSVQISQPGVYGRVDIGRFPQPAVVVAQPVVVAPAPVLAAPPQPVYMWVPPGHRKNWRKHCGQYNACGVPVYFVQDQWYRAHVAPPPPPPRYDDRDRGPGHGHGRGHGRGHD